MAHEIESNDSVVLGSNLPAWHGLGQVFPGLLSPLRVHAEGVGARDIIEVPVYADGLVVEGKKGLIAIHSNGNRTALDVAASTYGVLKDQTFFEILDQVYSGRAVVETAGTLRNGRRIWVLVRRESFEVTAGDKIESFDLWVNRHDGSGCFELHSTNVRVVCANTWRQALGSGKNRVFGVRHTTNVVFAAKTAADVVAKARESEIAARAQLRMLAEKRISVDTAVKVYRDILEVPADTAPEGRVKNNLDALVSLFRDGAGNEGRTAWDAFNSVTEFVDHHRTIRVAAGRDRGEAKFESAVLGNGDDLKASAYDLLLTV